MERTAGLWMLVLLFACCVSIGLCLNATAQPQSQIDENEMGMEVYFDIVKMFLGDVVQRKNISSSFLNLSTVFVDGKFDEDSLTDWKQWAEYLIGYAVCAAIGILFIVVMPLAGLIFCCCRLCGKCGAQQKEYESKRAGCKRGSYCTLLLILNTVMLGGAICGLVCVSLLQGHMQSDDKGTVVHIQSGLQEVERFLDNSVVDISQYVNNEFDEISEDIILKVKESGQNAVDDALNLLNATSLLAEARGVSEVALNIKSSLDSATDTLGYLQNATEELGLKLEEIQKDVDSVCTAPNTCEGYDPNQYRVTTNFTNLGSLEKEAIEVGKSLNISTYVDEAERNINAAKAEASKSIETETEKANTTVNDVKKAIQTGLDELNTQKDDLSKDLKGFQNDLHDSKGDVKKYSDYVYYAGLGIFGVMLLIILLYYVGVLYGLCGERPGHGAPCCNTGTGANFLMAGVAFTFLLTWLLMIVCVVLFLVGGPAYTEVCRYFDGHDPQKFQVFDDALTKGLDLSAFYENPPSDLSLVKTLQGCQNNDPLFNALNLDSIVDLDEILNLKELDSKLEELKTTNINIQDVVILTPQLRDELKDLADSGIEKIEFRKYFDELNKDLVEAPLEQVAATLDGIALNKRGEQKDTLERNAQKLRDLANNQVVQISETMKNLNKTMGDIQKNSNLKDPLNHLIDSIAASQINFNANKTDLIKEEISKLADRISLEANESVEAVKSEIRNNKARCEPLSNALYTVSDSVCILVLRPLNGFWFSLGWCLIFSIPCLVFAVLLTSQYRREHKYIKEFEDPNYLMYGGPNPDTIPLTSIMEDQRYHGGRGGPPMHGGGAGYGGHGSHHGYAQPGESNPGYIHDPYKASPPPPYEDHSRYHRYQGQHLDLAAEYPGGPTGKP